MIGINNRNLRDLSTDISRTFDFAPTIPDDRIIISESGIYSNAQVRELAPAVDGFLVGSSLMDPKNNPYQDIDLACRKLIYGNNKVCGLTDVEYSSAAADSGARFGGLIFALIYMYYYKFGDTFLYHEGATILSQTLIESPGDYFRLLFSENANLPSDLANFSSSCFQGSKALAGL